jgi:hypothetical protein
MNLCEQGERIAKDYKDVVVAKDGEPTPLYYHIQDCEACEELRNESN